MMVKYSYPIVGLLAMLLRPKTSYPIDLPESISESVSRLGLSLTAGDIERSRLYSYQVLNILPRGIRAVFRGGNRTRPGNTSQT